MVSLGSLWLPILVSAVLAFLASSVIHMVLGYHTHDVRKAPDEDAAQDAFRRLGIGPGDYGIPKAESAKAMKDPVFVEKMNRGPIVFMTVIGGGQTSMGASLAQWFVYCIVVSVFSAYIASRALPAAADYLDVFRFAGTTAFACYAMALPQASIWYKRNWATTARSMVDGLIYGALTAGTFGWLWPA